MDTLPTSPPPVKVNGMEVQMETFAERLKFARLEAKISQESLAHQVGVSKASISKLEINLTEYPNFPTGLAICNVLQVDPQWLATGKSPVTGEKYPPLRYDANAAIAELPEDMKIPILDLIEKAAEAAKQRYWKWMQEREAR